MNIRVDLNTPIKDGTEVVFRSPVDCSQVTGLKVYYLGESQEFVFADAHGNNVGDIDHLFAENVVVKVILDVAHGMAFVQNADTNAYLEGRFNDIINKLCPSFDKKGTLVQCEPVAGYPLSVSAKEDGELTGVTVTVCGKNLYDKTNYPLNVPGYPYSVNNNNAGAITNSDNYRRTGFIPVEHLQGQTIVLNHPPSKYVTVSNPGMSFYKYLPDANIPSDFTAAWCGGTTGASMKVPENAEYMVFCVRKQDSPIGSEPKDIQIEIGSQSTDYEPFNEEIFESSGDAAGEFIPVEGVFGRAGVMTFYAYNSRDEVTEVKVSGKADPVAIIEKLTKAINSLAVNVKEE